MALRRRKISRQQDAAAPEPGLRPERVAPWARFLRSPCDRSEIFGPAESRFGGHAQPVAPYISCPLLAPTGVGFIGRGPPDGDEVGGCRSTGAGDVTRGDIATVATDDCLVATRNRVACLGGFSGGVVESVEQRR